MSNMPRIGFTVFVERGAQKVTLRRGLADRDAAMAVAIAMAADRPAGLGGMVIRCETTRQQWRAGDLHGLNGSGGASSKSTDEGGANDGGRTSVLPEGPGSGRTLPVESVETLRAALQARDDLLAVVAHDMSNALHAIGLTAKAVRAAPAGSAARFQTQAETIVRVTERLGRLTRDLTDLALLDGGRLSLLTAPFEPNEVIEAAAAELVPVASERSMYLRIERSPVIAYGRGDRGRLLQVLVNLGGNAVKFAPPGSTITIGASVEAQGFRFHVADEGPGIPPSLRERVFRAGVRAARSDGGGTGLGLAIAKTIVELMRGSIRVEPVEPRGARFLFEVPRVVSAG